MTSQNTRRFDEVRPGDSLPELAVPITVAEQIEARRGPSKLTSALRFPGRWRRRELEFAD